MKRPTRRLIVVLLGVGCVAAAISAPALEEAAPTSVVGSFAPTVSLVPLLITVTALWWQVRPATCRSGISVGPCVAVAAAGLALAFALGVVVQASPVLPHPLVMAEITVLAALEELVFRGILLIGLLHLGRRLLPPRALVLLAVTLVAILFAVAHPFSGWLLFGERLWFSALTAALVLRSGQVQFAIALHAAYNLFAVISVAFASPEVATWVALGWTTSITGILLASLSPDHARRSAEAAPDNSPDTSLAQST